MAEPGETLSEREVDVLQCVSRGASNKEIASELSISQNTVKVHLRDIYTKLNVSSRTEATTAGIQQGYIVVSGVDGSTPSAQTETIPETETETTGEASSASHQINEAEGRRWRIPLLLLLLLLSVIIIVLLGREVMNQNQAAVTPEPFEEMPIVDSRSF